MIEQRIELGGLSTIAVGRTDADLVVVVLHGRSMAAADLAPFAHSLDLDAWFLFPDAPLPTKPRGFSWWPVDMEVRAARLASGPSDLCELDPPGRSEMRAALTSLCAALGNDRRIVLVGFSQGGMLVMDSVLNGLRPAAIALLSTSRIAYAQWKPVISRLAGLPVLASHGRDDAELAFSAGQAVRDMAVEGGADVIWIPHDGGHEIPLLVWRKLKRFLRRFIETDSTGH